jgi:hypothetical protein
MNTLKPTLSESINQLKFSWENGLSVELHHLDEKSRAEIWAWHNNGTNTLIDVSELNLLAPRSRDDYCKRLKARTPGVKDFDWNTAFDFIVPMALQARRKGEPIIELGRNDAVIKKPAWDCYPLVVSGMLNLIFGDRGSLKSKLTLYLAIMMMIPDLVDDWGLGINPPSRNLKVLKLDYEATQESDEYEWRRILRGLDEEGAVQLNYRACRRPLADDIEAISNHADAVKADVLIIDSLGPAAGGNLNDSEPALKFGEAVRQLNRTVICPAHTAKNQFGKRTVYGNAFYENLARNIWEVNKEEDEEDESTVQHIALHQTKSPPFSPHHRDMALQFDFDEESERIEVTKYDPDKMDVVNEKKKNPRKILECLKGDKLPIVEISERTGIGKDVCKTTLYRLLKSQKVTKVGEEWGLAYYEQ